MRTLAQAGVLPTVLRLSDEAETAINLAEPAEVGGESAGGCLMVTGFEGTQEAVDAKRAAVHRAAHRARRHLARRGRSGWASGRFHGPYLRDSLLDVGVLVETARDGDVLVPPPPGVRRGEGGADRRARRGRLSCSATSHTSTRPGASLYFTVAAKQTDDPVAQWLAAKAAASRRDDRQRRLDHPSPRRRPGPQAVAGPRRSARSAYGCCAR